MQTIADDICIVKSMYTEAINHDPAITFINTGNQQPGYASMGAWISYGLGSENENLPTFIAMISQGTGKNPGQPIFSRLWGSGFLPSSHQGVGLRPGANPVLYLDDPPGIDRDQRRALLDDLAQLNHLRAAETGDPETLARINAYEMAFRMQTSVPELTDLSGRAATTIIESLRPRSPQSRQLRRQLPAGAAGCSSAASASCSSSTAAGTSTSPSSGSCPTNAATSINPPPRC